VLAFCPSRITRMVSVAVQALEWLPYCCVSMWCCSICALRAPALRVQHVSQQPCRVSRVACQPLPTKNPADVAACCCCCCCLLLQALR
jgi:hypothetical protein